MNMKKSQIFEGTKAHFTSTPVKDKPSLVSLETTPLLITSTPNTTLPLSERIPESGVESRKEEDVVDAILNPGDPNDIDKIYSKQKNTFPKYISPLDNVKRCCIDSFLGLAGELLIVPSVCHRVVKEDPFSIICPYDVDGNCRDPECIYKHLSK